MSVNAGPTSVKSYINGRKIACNLRRMSQTSRALHANDAVTGAVALHALTRSQAAALFGTNVSYIDAVGRASDEERARLRAGEVAIAEIHSTPKPPTDEAVDALVDNFIDFVGADKILAALDRATRPTFPFAVAAE
jgi:hypothetical protein